MKKDYILPDLNEARKRNKEAVERIDFIENSSLNKIGENKKYFIITHGCQANQRDSETMAGILESLSYTPCDKQEDADIVLINTCAIRQGAEEKVYGEIGALKRLKMKNPDLVIGVAGCMAQEERTVKILMEKYRQVDIIFGTHNIHDLPRLIQSVYETKNRKIEVFSKMGEIVENVPVTRFMKHKAWVNIMYGCDKFCTYCIVPYTRGKERSRSYKDILFEVQELKDQGYKEICLLGQNVNAYGKDIYPEYGFGELLEDVAKIGIDRIRFMTSHPWDFNDKMIDAMKKYDNIMPYIHLPLQSGSSEVLRRMNRRYTQEKYLELFDKLKTTLPHYSFTTDIIVGFPTETDDDFLETLKVVDHCEYDNAFTFIFSAREGTPAYTMEDTTPREVKEERLRRLNEKVAFYANKNNQKYQDKIVEVLVDGLSKKNDNVYSGYSKENKLVNFTGNNIEVGQLVNVKITEVMSFSLNGVAIEK